MDCGSPGSSVRGIFQARMLEWVAISSSRASSRPGHRARISCISCTAGGLITTEPLGEGRQPVSPSISPFSSPEACKQRLAWRVRAQSLQSCPTLCNPMDCGSPGSSVHGILQARILEWVAILSPGDLPHPGIELTSLVSPALTGGFFTTCATWEAPSNRCVS